MKGITPGSPANPELVLQIGVEPNRIDVLTGIEGVRFDGAWRRRVRVTYGGVRAQVLSRADCIRTERATERPQDLMDLKTFTHRRRPRKKPKRKPR